MLFYDLTIESYQRVILTKMMPNLRSLFIHILFSWAFSIICEHCPVPELAALCQSDCIANLELCTAKCESDEEAGFKHALDWTLPIVSVDIQCGGNATEHCV